MYTPREPRLPSRYKVGVRTPKSFVQAQVINVSSSGCLLRVDGPLRRGQRVSFIVLGERIEGLAVRDQVGRAAVRFERSLSRSQLDAIRNGEGGQVEIRGTSADRTTALRIMERVIRMGAP